MKMLNCLLLALFTLCLSTMSFTAYAITVGAERSDVYLPLLKNKRVGAVVNQTARVKQGHLIDFLLQNNVNVKRVFAPEHGFRGQHDAGEHVKDGIDSKTGVSIVSVYGANKKPKRDALSDLDVLIFDIQDVGVRFYTYISTMHYMMEVAAELNLEFIVLDRPNPNIQFVEGPVLDKAYQSFVGMHEIPTLHGMTVAELAKMIKGEKWIDAADALKLTVIPVADYSRSDEYELPIAPSPNLPNQQAVYLYPSLCFFEPTAVSIGRGTDFPFQVLGHNRVALGEFSFSPRSIVGAAKYPKLENKRLQGIDLRSVQVKGLDLTLFIETHTRFLEQGEVFYTSESFMDKLAGTNLLRLAIEQGLKAHQIKMIWEEEIKAFKSIRMPYLLYQ